ncbi:unannotated protein [freshwater metagenome]|uniref:Unannotated protein n=1 Tax=freshwater metagenome TaxID=449393 RepID=A0A6J7I259_9ZZZZ
MHRICVLELVDEENAVLIVNLRSDLSVAGKQVAGPGEESVEVDDSLARPIVTGSGKYLPTHGERLADRVLKRCHEARHEHRLKGFDPRLPFGRGAAAPGGRRASATECEHGVVIVDRTPLVDEGVVVAGPQQRDERGDRGTHDVQEHVVRIAAGPLRVT